MGILRAVLSAFVNVLNFSGRASRREFWYFHLVMFLVPFAASLYAALVMPPETLLTFANWIEANPGYLSISLVFWVMSWSLLVRRLHDSDRRGWWVLISFVPLLGALVLLVFAVQPGTPGPNRFGAPRAGEAETEDVAVPRAKAAAQPVMSAEDDRKAEVHALYLARVKQAPS